MAATVETRKIEIIANGSKVNASFKDMAASVRLMNNQLQKMTPGTQEFITKSKELQTVKARMGEVKEQMYGTQQAQKQLTDQFGAYIPFYGTLQKLRAGWTGVNAAVSGNLTGLKLLRVALISTGIGAIVVVLGSLITFLATTQEGMDKVTAVTRPLAAIFQRLLGVVQELGGKVFNQLAKAMDNPKQALQELGTIIKDNIINRFEAFGKFIPGFKKILEGDLYGGVKALGNATVQLATGVENGLDKIGDAAKKTKEFVDASLESGTKIDQLQKEIEKQDIANTVRRAELNKIFAENKEIAQDLSKTEEERITAAQAAEKAQNDLLQLEQDFLEKKIELKIAEQKQNNTDRVGEKELQDLLAQKIEFEVDRDKKRAAAKALENSARKQIAAEAAKYASEQQKAEEDYLKAVSETTYAIEDLRIAAMEEGLEKQLALLDLKQVKEKEKLSEQRQAILDNDRITAQQRTAQLAQFDELRKLKEESFQAEIREVKKAAAEKEAEDRAAEVERLEEERQARIDKEMDQFDEDLERELLLEELRQESKNELQTELFATVLDRELAQEQALLELRKQYAQKKLDLLIASGQAETTEALKLKKEILGIEKTKADTEIDYEQRKVEFKNKLAKQVVDTTKAVLQATIDVLNENTKAYKAAAIAMKAIRAGEVIAAGIQEVQGIWQHSNTELPVFVSTGYAVLQTIASIARTVSAVSKIKSLQFAEGGGTGLSTTRMLEMQLRNGTYSYEGKTLANQGTYASGGMIAQPSIGIVGERGSEWVGPNWMLTSPKYANVFRFLERERLKGRTFASGGETVASGASFGSQAMDSNLEQFSTYLERVDQYMAKVDKWASTLQVHNNPIETDRVLQVRNQIDQDSTLKR